MRYKIFAVCLSAQAAIVAGSIQVHAQTAAESGAPISEQFLNDRFLSRSSSVRSNPFAAKSGTLYALGGQGSNLTDQYLYEIPGKEGLTVQAELPEVGPQYPRTSADLDWYSSSVVAVQIGVPLPPIG